MANFFDEVDATGVVEEHIKQTLELEHDQSLTILQSYKEVRDQLAARLAHLPSGIFTSQHLRGVLAQVEGAINAINAKLGGAMVDGAREAAMQSIGHLVTELETFDDKFLGAVTPVNLNAALLANDTTNFLVTKYQSNLESYGSGLMDQIRTGLFSATLGETNNDQVVGRISKFFTAEEWKLRRIVRTELHNIYNMGKVQGMRALSSTSVPDLLKTLMHPMDQRTAKDSIYAAKLNLVVPIDEPFEYTWAGRRRVYMAPPDRPNDRSILVPYREEWGNAVGGAFISGRFPAAS